MVVSAIVKKQNVSKGAFILLLCVFLVISVSVLIFSPADIVEAFGVRNSYLALFGVALLGGASFLTSSSYFISIALLASAGLSVVWVALVAGVALTIGDIFIYSVGATGKHHIPVKLKKFFDRVSVKIHRFPKNVLPVGIFLYTGLTPLPADLLMLFLSFIGFSLKRAFLPILLGNILLAFLIAQIFG